MAPSILNTWIRLSFAQYLTFRSRAYFTFFYLFFAATDVEVTDSPLLTQQIASLRTALRLKTQECSKLTSDHIIREIKVKKYAISQGAGKKRLAISRCEYYKQALLRD